jgi:hypothetical protein
MSGNSSTMAWLLAVPGCLLQQAAFLWFDSDVGVFVWALVSGTVLLLAGLAFDARSRGRHPAWCLMALLGVVGVILIASLDDGTVRHGGS